jgi:AcrR family transcriptional regulator
VLLTQAEVGSLKDIAAAADVSPCTFFRYFESKLGLVMARSSSTHDRLGPQVAARPDGESPIQAVRQALLPGLVEQLGDWAIRRELQVAMTTPTLRNLAREHFYLEGGGGRRCLRHSGGGRQERPPGSRPGRGHGRGDLGGGRSLGRRAGRHRPAAEHAR